MADDPMSPNADASRSTARSRVLAMFAKMDSEAQTQDVRTLDDDTPEPSANLPDSNLEFDRPSLSMSSSEVDDEEDDVVIKPRGRIAARMAVGDSEPEPEPSAEAEGARERVKRLLSASKRKSSEPASRGENGDDDADNQRDVVASEEIQKPSPRQSTPEVLEEPDQQPTGGIFASPASHRSGTPARDDSDSDVDLPAIPAQDSRLMELVAKKREERLAREAEKRGLRESQAIENEDHERSDEDVERTLTQQARPTRKASKKAIEEMHRETQRMSRNMQLAHQAKTKKKVTKSSLFAKFNYRPTGMPEDEVEERTRPATSSSAPQSEADKHETPPTSPMSHTGDVEKSLGLQTEEKQDDAEEELPEVADVLRSDFHMPSSPPVAASKVDKGKGKAVEEVESDPKGRPKTIFTQRAIRVRPPKVPIPITNMGNDSDSDLEIVPVENTDSKKLSIFDRVPIKQAKESHSLQALRMLAHITSPGKKETARNKKASITASELGMSLQQRARQQAAREREEREQALREKGVVIQTAEEREKELADVEDILAKARREADELAKHEKIAAKKEQKANGEADTAETSSDDEEWEEEKENLAEELSGSGSEDEVVDDADISDDDSEEEEEMEDEARALDDETIEDLAAKPQSILIDNEASESEAEEEHDAIPDEDDAAFIDDGEVIDDEEVEGVKDLPNTKPRRKHHNVISDDEDDDAGEGQGTVLPHTDSPQPRQAESPMAPPSVLRSATKTFIPGLTVAGPAGLGLTQIFAGTMDDSQTQASDMSPSQFARGAHPVDEEQDSLAFLRNLPAPNMPEFKPTMDEDSQDVVKDSQTDHTQALESQAQNSLSQRIQLDFSQSQIHGFDSLPQDQSGTQYSDFTQLTQDAGFQVMSPIMGRFVEPPPSTVDTVVLETTPKPATVEESPVVKRKGKLRRRTEIPVLSDDEQEDVEEVDIGDEDFEISANAFDVMRKAAKKKEVVVDEFDKKKSGAKEMVEEQAEESEDEYAGLGGASDDDSEGEEDALVRAMIDDEAGKDVDERKLAAFYADKERANDEKQVEKLYKDITSGMLRRKRGADFDLSDSDDGGEARRRMKRREFAKMRKALFEDERIGKIAENPKKLAFLRAIEDRGDDDEEMDFLEDYAESNEGTDSQSQSQAEDSQKETTHIPDSQPHTVMGPPKRKLPTNVEAAKRPPPYLRRTQADKRPSNLSEIRQSLSSLIEEPNAIVAASHDDSSDSEPDNNDGDEVSDLKGKGKEKEKENRDPFARRNNIPIVDRISLQRANSNTVSSTTKLAFTANSATVGGFKVPPLLRRATTNSSISSSSSSVSATERGRANESKGFVKKGATKNSGVHYFARERERIEKAAEGEKKREEKRLKHAAGRRTVVGGLFGMGKFE